MTDDNPDIVKRLTKISNVTCRVVPSTSTSAIVLGRKVLDILSARKDEEMFVGKRSPTDVAMEEERIITLVQMLCNSDKFTLEQR